MIIQISHKVFIESSKGIHIQETFYIPCISKVPSKHIESSLVDTNNIVENATLSWITTKCEGSIENMCLQFLQSLSTFQYQSAF